MRITAAQSYQQKSLPAHCKASAPLEVARGTMKFSPCPSHNILSEFWLEDQPISILQDFLIAIMRESKTNLGCGVADSQEGSLLVGAIPAEGAIRAGAAALVAVIGLGAGGSEKDRKGGLGIKEEMRQLAPLECQSQ